MNMKREYPDADDGNPFLNLGSLLSCGLDGQRHVSVATLATAIETFGIYTWDQFGRFRLFKVGTPEADRALRLISFVYEFESSSSQGETQHPLDACSGEDDPYWQFGWASEVAPNFDAIRSGQLENRQPLRAKRSTREENNNFALIGALLELLLGTSPGGQKLSIYKDQAAVISALESRFGDCDGISKRTLEDKFPKARQLHVS